MPFYLVERFVPSVSSDELSSRAARLSSLDGPEARHLLTVVVPAEDTCISVFEAPGPLAVEHVNREAGLALDRIVEANVFGPLAVNRYIEKEERDEHV